MSTDQPKSLEKKAARNRGWVDKHGRPEIVMPKWMAIGLAEPTDSTTGEALHESADAPAAATRAGDAGPE